MYPSTVKRIALQVVALAGTALAASASSNAQASIGHDLPIWSVLPFVGLLLCIAILPLTAHHWFEQNRNRIIVAAGFGAPVLAYLLMKFGGAGGTLILHTTEEYISFICLLAALYTISGGIYITGNLLGTPGTNVAFYAIGAVLANLIGTTGAAMVLIRPFLRANSERKHKVHSVIFFIFIVCNCGGLLTPLGDPPLFLGFLRGVDFFWTMQLTKEWLIVNLGVIGIYLLLEVHYYRKESLQHLKEDLADYVPVGVAGKINFLFLAGVIGAVLASKPLMAAGHSIHFPFLRELIMLAMIGLSLKLAPDGPRAANHFSWGPIQEVAILFAGIFAAMIPALAILEARGGELGLSQPWHFFWVTGMLSSFLDNAPTYLTFMSTGVGYLTAASPTFAAAIASAPDAATAAAHALMSDQVLPEIGKSAAQFLAAISCGAVMMGANSYIGNAPNFMVKAIAESSGVKMPSFFGYMAWSTLVLLPLFALITLIFFAA